jgi:hypothetical protein
MKYFYEKNTEFVNSEVNKTFEEILWMSNKDFRQWLHDLRDLVVKLWDENNQPPRVGYDEAGIIHQFKKLEGFSVNSLLNRDELTGEENVIRNTRVEGNAVNQWFPSMMQTRITYSDVSKARSIYDWFKDPDLYERHLKFARRHFKRDSFYHYSNPVRANDPENSLIGAETGEEWIRKFETLEHLRDSGWCYWIDPQKDGKEDYSGYSDALRNVKWLSVSREWIENEGVKIIPDYCLTNMKANKGSNCRIRLFKQGQKLFPLGFKAFRISYCQYAVNFPPLTAKLIYERYTKEDLSETQIIWDPSAGWGGRLLGALACNKKRHIHYIGTDPNKDHTLPDGRTKYDDFAQFYNDRARESGLFDADPNTWEIHQCGSEVFRDTEAFQKYIGKVSVVFTSPPYFAKEVYSEDPEQSCHKFSEYEHWRDGFLKPTLENAYQLLKKDGYLIWNIADAVFKGDMLPLEEDSCNIMKELGLEHIETLKMALAQMPGGNRVDPETGKPTAKNFCKVNGLWLKYEPIFVFKKV